MKKILICMLVMALGACSFRSPQSQFYVMNSENLNGLSAEKLNIAVTRVKVPDMLDRPQMVVYDKDATEVQILEFHRWAEVLPNIIQNTITNDLMAYLPNAYVERSYFGSDFAQYSVNVEINHMEAFRGEKVVLAAWWNITDKKGKTVSKAQRRYVVQVKGNSIMELVNAQADAVHQMSKEIAETIIRQ